MKKKAKYLLLTLLLAGFLVLLLLTGWDIISRILLPKHGTWHSNLQLYQWVALGTVIFTIGKRFLKENLQWFETFTHELTHTIVSILLFRRIHSFEANNDNGLIMTSGNGKTLVFVDLAPYCLPIYTYGLLACRAITTHQFLWCIDLVIGISIAFHLHCFKKQIGNYQTDIKKRPLFFSYTYIAVSLVFNLCVIFVSFWSTKNVFTAFWFVCEKTWEHTFSW